MTTKKDFHTFVIVRWSECHYGYTISLKKSADHGRRNRHKGMKIFLGCAKRTSSRTLVLYILISTICLIYSGIDKNQSLSIYHSIFKILLAVVFIILLFCLRSENSAFPTSLGLSGGQQSLHFPKLLFFGWVSILISPV